MLTEFLEQKMRAAKYKILEDNTYFAEITRLKGVWANADNLEDCRSQLKEVLEDWILLKVRDHESIPGLKIRFDRRRLVQDA